MKFEPTLSGLRKAGILATLSFCGFYFGQSNILADCGTCAVGYPYASSNPRTSIIFNESEVLRGFGTNVLGLDDTIKVWYNDEHALMLGVRRVIVKTSNGTTTTDYPLSALTSNPGSVINPQVGATSLSGDQAGTDLSDRPLYPALFITDITDDQTNTSGDWQFGGSAITPHAVFGTWKSAVRTIDKTKNPPVVSISEDSDPAKNNWNLGSGDPAPAGLKNEGYGAEVRWNVGQLGLLPGHSYRLYFMVHDGDQNRVGGDTGQGCLNICVCGTATATSLGDQTNCAGSTVVFATTANGSGPLTFQWLKDGTPLPGQTNNILTLTNLSAASAGPYAVIVANLCGTVTNTATLTVNEPVVMTLALTNQTSVIGSNVTFTVGATGSGLRYQWFFQDALVGTNSTLTLNNLTTNQAGRYCAVVSGTCGSPATNCATLTVNVPVVVVTPPVNQTNCPGTTAMFNVTATGTSVSYQWFFGSDSLIGQTGSGLVLTNVSSGNAGTYIVVVSGAAGGPITNTATLTVSTNVIVTTPLMNLTNCVGTTAIFNVEATGTALTYQWYYGVTLLTAQTTNILRLGNVTVSNAGLYTVVVSGDCGIPVTNSATLVINEPVIVTMVPTNQVTVVGGNVVFTVSAMGTGLSYQWFFNNVLVGTNNLLNLNSVTTNQAGSYCSVVSGLCGNPMTNCSTLTISNRAPVAVADFYTGTEDRLLTVEVPGVLRNDSDLDGDPLQAILATRPSHGTLTLNTNGSFTYLPATNYSGTDTFTYRANDGFVNSGIATVTLTIEAVDDAPIANNDSYTVVEGGTLSPTAATGVLANDTDAETNILRAILVSNPTNGSLTLNTNGSFVYVHNGSETTVDHFTYRANDGITNSGVATVTITVTPVNDPPVANNDSYTVVEGGRLDPKALNGVLANDTDTETNILRAILVSNPTNGSLTLNTNGSFVYVHNGSETTVDHFTYRANDGITNSGVAMVTIIITPLNDPPVANNDFYTVAEGGTLSPTAAAGVLANDTDAETNILRAILVSNPTNGSLTLNTNGSFVYVHNGSETTVDHFTYRATDEITNSEIATVTITIIPLNDVPVANPDAYTLNEDQTLTVSIPGVLVNDTDAENNPLSAILVNSPTNGSLVLSPDGSFVYVPGANFNGGDTFKYKATDGTGESAVVNVSLNVNSVNDAPSFVVGPNQLVNPSTGPYAIANWATGISAGPANEQGQTLTFIVSNDNPTLFAVQPSINPDGTLRYVPGANPGAATVSVVLKDNGGTANGGVDTSAVQTFKITVNAPPTVSIASPTNNAVFIATQNITVVADAMDSDGTVTNVQFFSGTNQLSHTTNAPYFVVWTNVPAGTYHLTATATDNLGLTTTSSVVTISVIEKLPLTFVGPILYDGNVDLFKQQVRVFNPTPFTLEGARVLVFNLTRPGDRVYNANGTNNGTPFVQFNAPILPGQSANLTIEYYFPSRTVTSPGPTLVTEIVPPSVQVMLTGQAQRINRTVQFPLNKTFLLEFSSLLNRSYAIQYTSDLITWKTVVPTIIGTGSNVQWIDNGAPKTKSAPATADKRFYRVILLP